MHDTASIKLFVADIVVQELLNLILLKSYEISVWPIKDDPVSYLTKRYSLHLKK
jgi:hypothetical protein